MKRLILFLVTIFYISRCHGATHTEAEIAAFLRGEYENRGSTMCTQQVVASWNYETNISDETSAKSIKVSVQASKQQKAFFNEWFKDVDLESIKDPQVKRQLKLNKEIGTDILEENDVESLSKTLSDLTNIYSTAKICPYNKQDCDMKTEGLNLEPEISDIMTKSKDYDELAYVWKSWRDQTGKKMGDLYETYIELNNKAAKLNGFPNTAVSWMDDFEMPDLANDAERIWQMIKPLYDRLHSYTRKKLITVYGEDKIGTDGLIPAHILGNMWSQSWSAHSELLKPFPNEPQVNVTESLLQKGYTPLKMFQLANEFYTSLGLPSNAMSFGNDSMITKPKNLEVTCHASAWDFCDKKTFRIKMCTEVTSEYFTTIHHEMGHIQYYIQYKDQPITFREGANPGFHEAVGDTVALSVSAPSHLVKVGLLGEYVPTKEATINALMDAALEKIAFIPFGLLVDKWRWEVFAGNVSREQWNDLWWRYRMDYQKVKPPVTRNSSDFDPGAKFHIPGDSQYISYFIAFILEFQLFRSFCITSGQYDPTTKNPPLYNCDFYNSTAVGDKFKAGLSLGKSQHWKVALKAMTGEEDLDPTAILEYFEPLDEFLKSHSSADRIVINTSMLVLLLLVVTKVF